HAAAVAFDLLALVLLFLLGRRMRGPTLGIALAYAWVAYPFTLFALESNSNDTLVAALVLAALLAASYSSKLALAAAAALAAFPALRHDSLHTIYARTITYQANRGSPFSVWGLYGGLSGLQHAGEIAAVALALALALPPRRGALVGLAAACAAAIIATQLGLEHWFYLYIPWFFPLVMLARLGR